MGLLQGYAHAAGESTEGLTAAVVVSKGEKDIPDHLFDDSTGIVAADVRTG